MKRVVLSALALSLVVCATGVAQSSGRTAPSFGALEASTPAETKARLAAWLKDIGKADVANLQKLDAIWKETSRPMLDRVGDSFALGDPVAANLLREARDPSAQAPIVVPSVFKNEKQPAFFRANLALIYARTLVNRRVYEEALDTLNLFRAEQVVDPSSYLFHRAVCEHALQRKSEATKSINRLLEEGLHITPERYRTVAALMLVDMHVWKDKSLDDIARKMNNIERRLDIARGGPETQRQQREVLHRLDELIKKLEKKNPPPGGG